MIITPGQKLSLTVRPQLGNTEIIYVAVPDLPEYIQPGRRILLDDGNLELEVIDKSEEEITTQVLIGGKLSSHKGVNLPGAKFKPESPTAKDIEDLTFGSIIDI